MIFNRESTKRTSFRAVITNTLFIFGLSQLGNAYESAAYECSFLAINLDGSFGDWPKDSPWHSEAGIMAAMIDTDYGWAVEAAIPFDSFSINPTNGATIGLLD